MLEDSLQRLVEWEGYSFLLALYENRGGVHRCDIPGVGGHTTMFSNFDFSRLQKTCAGRGTPWRLIKMHSFWRLHVGTVNSWGLLSDTARPAKQTDHRGLSVLGIRTHKGIWRALPCLPRSQSFQKPSKLAPVTYFKCTHSLAQSVPAEAFSNHLWGRQARRGYELCKGRF